MSPTPKRLLQDRLPRPLFLVLLFSLFSFLSLGSALLTSPSTHATSSSINVSITGSPVVTVTPNAEGKFASGEFAVGITTTHASGYTFSIKAAEGPNPTRLNGTTTEGFLASITSPISTDTFKNDSTYNEQWGYKPSILYNSNTKENTANDNYLPSPSTAGDTLAVTHTAGDSSYPISIGTRVTVATVEDVYSNTFVFTAIANPTPYTLTYNANTSDSVSNMPANISDGETNGETFNISNTVPTRSGYDFKGWCASQVADGATCPTTTYNPDGDGSNLTYTIDQTSATNNVTLYAVWGIDEIILYDKVASMSKGKQTITSIRAAIRVPTSANRAQDTSNSGVYEYDPSVFGTSSDASNDNKIYYYRGVLENNVGSYGSDGSAVTYPNYVKLGNTCWRIVRTTGSGGVKMIYNGVYGATTAGSCANTQANAQAATSAFNGASSANRQIVRVGYTYNSTYATNTSKTGTIAQIFGTNSNPSANDTRSDIKTYIEDTWYTSSNGVSAYTNILEPSAGYCNDRTMNTTESWTAPLTESSTIDSTYGTSSQQAYYFGAYPRNASTAQLPSLACGNKYSQIDRSAVDLYRYNGTNGAAGTTTANYLKYPAALLTSDEAALAGSGRDKSTTPYHANSFLRSGSNFWSFSPDYRNPSGLAVGFYLSSNGSLSDYFVNYANGVRPVISLISGTIASSGSGTATDPWVVDAP